MQGTQVSCPNCGKHLSVPSEYVGRNGRCPFCGSVFVIQQPQEEEWPSLQNVEDIPSNAVHSMCSPAEYNNFAWRRWTARCIDFQFGFGLAMILFFSLGLFSGVTGIGLEFWEWIAEPEHRAVDYVMTTMLAFFSDSLVFAIFKQTLGKKICGISVCDMAGRRISVIGFLKRDIAVLFRGECLCLPLFSAIANIVQYNRVSKGKSASYDEGCVYQSRPTRAKAWYDGVLAVAVLIVSALIRAMTA